jgi:hypothetical protein
MLRQALLGLWLAAFAAQGASAQFKEEKLDDLPAVDRSAASRTAPPAALRRAPTPVREADPSADSLTARSGERPPGGLRIETYRNQPEEPEVEAPDDDEPARRVSTAPSRPTPPPAPRPSLDAPGAPLEAAPVRRAAPSRTTALAGCTRSCIANCESEFAECNGRASPAKSACVRQLEACRPERCGCGFR